MTFCCANEMRRFCILVIFELWYGDMFGGEDLVDDGEFVRLVEYSSTQSGESEVANSCELKSPGQSN